MRAKNRTAFYFGNLRGAENGQRGQEFGSPGMETAPQKCYEREKLGLFEASPKTKEQRIPKKRQGTGSSC